MMPFFQQSIHHGMKDVLVLTSAGDGTGKVDVHDGFHFIIAIPAGTRC